MSVLAFDACVDFRLLSPSTGFFLFFVAQKGVRISGAPSSSLNIHEKYRFLRTFWDFFGKVLLLLPPYKTSVSK